MPKQSDNTKREKFREYTRKRYENNPEKHEKTKERLRLYMLKRRSDPEYRQMETDRRRERRRMQRESKGGTRKTSTATKRTPEVKQRMTRSTKSSPITKKGKSDMEDFVESQSSHFENVEALSCSREREFLQKFETSYESIPDNDHEDLSGHHSAGEPEEDDPIMVDDYPKPSTTRQSTDRQSIDTSITNPLMRLCDCSQSNALSKFAAMSRELSGFDRRRFEVGLLQYMDDFVNSTYDDTFMMFISDKLKRVSDDSRPDLEISILTAINSVLKKK